MRPLRVTLVVGARPNFVKAAPVLRMMTARPRRFAPVLVHTGQHYDDAMSGAFFRDLAIPVPRHRLRVGPGTHVRQIARTMLGLERILAQARPDWVVVVGDVNSTVAAALTAVKRGVRTAHVEAGLRSHDRTMPEEINRIVTDAIADLLLTPSADADRNLRAEGCAPERIARVGNVMIDSLMRALPDARRLRAWEAYGLEERGYVIVTLHRPSNVDDRTRLAQIVSALAEVSVDVPVVFPVHPRTAASLRRAWRPPRRGALRLVAPLGYVPFLSLLSGAGVVLTDSGGIQEETTVLGVPCLTFRDTTERPITITKGTNTLIGTDVRRIVPSVRRCLRHARPAPPAIPLWDGHAARRIGAALLAAT